MDTRLALNFCKCRQAFHVVRKCNPLTQLLVRWAQLLCIVIAREPFPFPISDIISLRYNIVHNILVYNEVVLEIDQCEIDVASQLVTLTSCKKNYPNITHSYIPK